MEGRNVKVMLQLHSLIHMLLSLRKNLSRIQHPPAREDASTSAIEMRRRKATGRERERERKGQSYLNIHSGPFVPPSVPPSLSPSVLPSLPPSYLTSRPALWERRDRGWRCSGERSLQSGTPQPSEALRLPDQSNANDIIINDVHVIAMIAIANQWTHAGSTLWTSLSGDHYMNFRWTMDSTA